MKEGSERKEGGRKKEGGRREGEGGKEAAYDSEDSEEAGSPLLTAVVGVDEGVGVDVSDELCPFSSKSLPCIKMSKKLLVSIYWGGPISAEHDKSHFRLKVNVH